MLRSKTKNPLEDQHIFVDGSEKSVPSRDDLSLLQRGGVCAEIVCFVVETKMSIIFFCMCVGHLV
jgi:hypothetical protein